jgi:hypothetical protein
VTIRGGWLGDGLEDLGGGVACLDAAPVIEDCIFRDNRAWKGGGLYFRGDGPELRRCRFVDNSARLMGGGVAAENASAPTLSVCHFTDNSADYGGGLGCTESDLELEGCLFWDNRGRERGGALYAAASSTLGLATCTLACNVAPAEGGSGISLATLAHIEAAGIIVAQGLGGQAVDCRFGATMALSCSNLFDNEGGDWTDCVAPQLGTDGNIAADPSFCGERCDGDFGLREGSPSSEAVSGCGGMGAFPVSCDADRALRSLSWSLVKIHYGN